MNQAQSTKQQVKGLGSLFLLRHVYCPKNDPHTFLFFIFWKIILYIQYIIHFDLSTFFFSF